LRKFKHASEYCYAYSTSQQGKPAYPAPLEGDYIINNFTFESGETLPELRLHYTTIGTPAKDARGVVHNAVLIMHGTTGSGRGGSGLEVIDRGTNRVIYSRGFASIYGEWETTAEARAGVSRTFSRVASLPPGRKPPCRLSSRSARLTTASAKCGRPWSTPTPAS
jgi:hypothetical protein